MADQQLLLLLDGLDEVKEERRADCIQALNQFLQDYGQTEMVVCSRLQEYELLARSNSLQLQAAICIRPLTSEQVDLYLQKAGDQLTALKGLLHTDETLRALACSPLMLSVMSLAYQHKALEEIPHPGSVEEHRRHVFDTYIQQAFRRRGGEGRQYSEAKTIHWLVKLAQRMSPDSQTIFLIERMQPAWLPTDRQIFWYRLGTVLASGLIGGLVFGLTGGLSGGLSCSPNGRLSWHWGDGLQWGVVLGLVGAIAGLLVMCVEKGDIELIETFEISWPALTRSLIRKHTLSRSLTGAMIGAVGAGLCTWLTNASLQDGVVFGLTWGGVFGLVLGISAGMTGSAIETRVEPNQGIWRSALNAGWVGFIFGLTIALLAQLGFMLMDLHSNCKWLAELLIMLGFGGLGMLVNEAGKACIQHFTLRVALFAQGIIPWNYARFLDCAVADIFLQRASGAYFFIHRTLMEHFAQSSQGSSSFKAPKTI